MKYFKYYIEEKIELIIKILAIGVILAIAFGCSIQKPQTRVITNNTQLHNLLRDDFVFRYNFAQFNQNQPISWHYSNRFLGTTNFNGYFSYNNRHQLWNDWFWNYPFNNNLGFTYSWRNRRWSNNSFNYWNNYNVPFRYRRARNNPSVRRINPPKPPRSIRPTRSTPSNIQIESIRSSKKNPKVIKNRTIRKVKPIRTKRTTKPTRTVRRTTRRVKSKTKN